MRAENLAQCPVQQVGSSMIVLYRSPPFPVNMEAEAFRAVRRNTLRNMYSQVVFLYGVRDEYLLAALRHDISGVTDLASHLAVERCALEHELVHCLVLGLDGAVSCELHAFDVSAVVSEELDIIAMGELYPVTGLYRSGVACPFLLFHKLGIEAFKVYLESVF